MYIYIHYVPFSRLCVKTFFSLQNFRRTFLAGTQWLAQQSVLKNCATVQSPKDNCSEQTFNLLMFALNQLLPILDQYLTRSDRDLVSSCSEKLAEVRENEYACLHVISVGCGVVSCELYLTCTI